MLTKWALVFQRHQTPRRIPLDTSLRSISFHIHAKIHRERVCGAANGLSQVRIERLKVDHIYEVAMISPSHPGTEIEKARASQKRPNLGPDQLVDDSAIHPYCTSSVVMVAPPIADITADTFSGTRVAFA